MFSGSTYSMMELRIRKMAAMLDFKMADKTAANEIIFANSAKTIAVMQVILAGIPMFSGSTYSMTEVRSRKNVGHFGFQDGRQISSQ